MPSSLSKFDGSAPQCTKKVKKLVDHPVVAWLIENCSIWLVAFVASLFTPKKRNSFLKTLFWNFISGCAVVEVSMLIQRFLVRVVYAHIPYFAGKKRPRFKAYDVFYDFLRTLVPSQAIGSLFNTVMIRQLDAKEYYMLHHSRFNPLTWLIRMATVRFVVDLVFFGGHYILHSKLYAIHKRHHEHVKTALPTNYHFTVPDLLIEGFLPVYVAVIVLAIIKNQGLKMFKSTAFDSALYFSYILWYEIGSHCGKPLPTVSMFPPFSILYNCIGKGIDRHNVKFHEKHHNLVNCNYGITPWLDRLFGTCKPSDLYDN